MSEETQQITAQDELILAAEAAHSLLAALAEVYFKGQRQAGAIYAAMGALDVALLRVKRDEKQAMMKDDNDALYGVEE